MKKIILATKRFLSFVAGIVFRNKKVVLVEILREIPGKQDSSSLYLGSESGYTPPTGG